MEMLVQITGSWKAVSYLAICAQKIMKQPQSVHTEAIHMSFTWNHLTQILKQFQIVKPKHLILTKFYMCCKNKSLVNMHFNFDHTKLCVVYHYYFYFYH